MLTKEEMESRIFKLKVINCHLHGLIVNNVGKDTAAMLRDKNNSEISELVKRLK